MYFLVNHSSTIILEALQNELERLKVEVKTSINIKSIKKRERYF